jgi:hypothetical protein
MLPPDALTMDYSALLAQRPAVVLHKLVKLPGTLIEAVLSGETAICIHDVRQHINDHPETDMELLFQVNKGTLGSMLLVPMLDSGAVRGGLYLTSRVKHTMSYKQLDVEVLMMVVSKLIVSVLGSPSSAPPRLVFTSRMCAVLSLMQGASLASPFAVVATPPAAVA